MIDGSIASLDILVLGRRQRRYVMIVETIQPHLFETVNIENTDLIRFVEEDFCSSIVFQAFWFTPLENQADISTYDTVVYFAFISYQIYKFRMQIICKSFTIFCFDFHSLLCASCYFFLILFLIPLIAIKWRFIDLYWTWVGLL